MGKERLLIVCSFLEEEMHRIMPKKYRDRKGKIVLCNYPIREEAEAVLMPYETRVYEFSF